MALNRSNSSNASGENWCNTECQADEVVFHWSISNFDFHEAEGTDLVSSIFSGPTNDKIKWCLRCKPNGETDAKDTISLYLELKSFITEKMFAKYSFSVLDKQKNVMNTGTSFKVREFSPIKQSWGFKQFLKKDKQFRNKLQSNSNKLMIRCKIEFSDMKNVHTDFHQRSSEISACNLSEDLALLFENQEFSDVILTVKGKNHNVHKQILVARSPVFAAMFRHNTTEAEKNNVVIEDVDEDVMDEVLRYIYTGKCQDPSKVADGLLAAADKYALDGLKIICIEELCKTLSTENAVNRLVLADLHGAMDLKIEAIKFITAKFVEIMNTPVWKNIMLSNPELAGEVCQAFARR